MVLNFLREWKFTPQSDIYMACHTGLERLYTNMLTFTYMLNTFTGQMTNINFSYKFSTAK